jgi:RNA polymerase sigma-70 factor (ECF subfamily)
VNPARFTPAGRWADPPRRWEEDTPEKLLLQEEARTTLMKRIADLPPRQRIVITLRDVEGLDSEEVCNILEISETNQRVVLHRARSKVRRALEQYLLGK